MRTSSLRVSAGYHQYSLEWAEWDPGAIPFKGGNGLAWVSPGRIVVLTGVDSGDVPVEFSVSETEPPLDLDDWDEVVEVSADITATTVGVFVPDGIHVGDLELPAAHSYRLWMHARGRDAGQEAEFIEADEGDEMVEHHRILIWPAQPAPEARHKLTDTVGRQNRSQ